MFMVLGLFATQSWLIQTRSFSNLFSLRLRLNHTRLLLCCPQCIKVSHGPQHPRARCVLLYLRLVFVLPPLRFQLGHAQLLQRLALPIHHLPRKAARVIPRARSHRESAPIHGRCRGWVHGHGRRWSDVNSSWANVPGDKWGQCDESQPIAHSHNRAITAGFRNVVRYLQDQKRSVKVSTWKLATQNSTKNWLGPIQVTTTCWNIMKIREICWYRGERLTRNLQSEMTQSPLGPNLASNRSDRSQVYLLGFESNSVKAPVEVGRRPSATMTLHSMCPSWVLKRGDISDIYVLMPYGGFRGHGGMPKSSILHRIFQCKTSRKLWYPHCMNFYRGMKTRGSWSCLFFGKTLMHFFSGPVWQRNRLQVWFLIGSTAWLSMSLSNKKPHNPCFFAFRQNVK